MPDKVTVTVFGSEHFMVEAKERHGRVYWSEYRTLPGHLAEAIADALERAARDDTPSAITAVVNESEGVVGVAIAIPSEWCENGDHWRSQEDRYAAALDMVTESNRDRESGEDEGLKSISVVVPGRTLAREWGVAEAPQLADLDARQDPAKVNSFLSELLAAEMAKLLGS